MIGFTTSEEVTVQRTNKSKSILELYPQYDFDLAHTVFSQFSNLIVVYSVVPIWWGVLLLMLIFGIPGRLKRLRTRSPRIAYIQKPHFWAKVRPLMFMVDENRKWGLLNQRLKVMIEPQYDSMKWIKEYKLIEVSKGDVTYIVDINNNKCV